MNYDDLGRSERSYWRADKPTGPGRALTLDDFKRFADACTVAPPAPTFMVTTIGTLEYAGQALGWPELEAYFEAIARGAAHTIFGNIALDVRAAVSARRAGEFVLGGVWPFTVAPWSEPQQVWNEWRLTS